MIARICGIILMMLNFNHYRYPHLPTCQSLRKGSQESEDTQMDYECLKTYYDACSGGVRRIFLDHCESSGTNLAQLAVSYRIGLLEGCAMFLFKSWRYYDWDRRVLWFDDDG